MAYDGRAYHGWQIQENALSVQEVFQNALGQVIGGDFDVKGCSRTDSGVHANQYCVSLKTGHRIPCERLVAALNRFLPMDMAVKKLSPGAVGFSRAVFLQGKGIPIPDLERSSAKPLLEGRAFHYWYPWIRTSCIGRPSRL